MWLTKLLSYVQKLFLYVKIILSGIWWLFSYPNNPLPFLSVWDAVLNHQIFQWENDDYDIISSKNNFLGNPREKNC